MWGVILSAGEALLGNEERITGNLIYASFVHTETRPIDGIPDPHYHIHAFAFNATFDPEEERWKAGEFGNIKRDAPFYEAAFHARLAEKLLENGFAKLFAPRTWRIR